MSVSVPPGPCPYWLVIYIFWKIWNSRKFISGNPTHPTAKSELGKSLLLESRVVVVDIVLTPVSTAYGTSL